MHFVLLIEEDALIRDVMREHLERDGFAVSAVSSVASALELLRFRNFGLVLMDFSSARSASRGDLDRVRSFGAPVAMLSTSPRGKVVAYEGELESVMWSPFDPATLTRAVRRFVSKAPATLRAPAAPPPVVRRRSADEFVPAESGTYRATRPAQPRSGSNESTLPAPPDPQERADRDESLERLGRLVMDATALKRKANG